MAWEGRLSCAGGAVSQPHSPCLHGAGQRRGNLRPVRATVQFRTYGMSFEQVGVEHDRARDVHGLVGCQPGIEPAARVVGADGDGVSGRECRPCPRLNPR